MEAWEVFFVLGFACGIGVCNAIDEIFRWLRERDRRQEREE